MSIEQAGVIDAMGVDKETGKVFLTISDHLEWDDEHLLLLQEKLNLYLGFIEGGELLEVYPDSKGREVVISVICKCSPNATGKEFLSRVGSIVKEAGVGFVYRVSEFG
ncbi:hypothetical protein LOY35_03585 [Pseudomonas sp. B21-028]|uniref:DUF6572 domain-containing protein n=1 Tax=Pseudomonas sp. B21-028 TaxID=2895480 RepID=UPI002160C76D|nr:DUF6572 domain-containing protein [Pseudomonas sp. B21-028]UVL84684.1 hypothetical protein LOY35_03585 [Pseudomonas sp. B21-028]